MAVLERANQMDEEERCIFCQIARKEAPAYIIDENDEVIVVPRERLPEHLRPDEDTDQHLVVDTARIREELGYEERVPLDEVLRRTVAWERAHPPEQVNPEQFDYAAEDAVLADLGRHHGS